MKELIPREHFEVGDSVVAEKITPLPGKQEKPPLKLGKEYEVLEIFLDNEGCQHLHVGLVSKLQFITSYETNENLPDGDKKHWCHPSRFKKVPKPHK